VIEALERKRGRVKGVKGDRFILMANGKLAK
jgi:hypothetical protein